MADWVDDIAASELIWIRASVSNKRIFYDYDEAVFTKGELLFGTKIVDFQLTCP